MEKLTRREIEVFSKANQNRLKLHVAKSGYALLRKSRKRMNDVIFNSFNIEEVDEFLDLFSEEREGSYQEVKGDLMKLASEGKFDAIGHGCNCFATMGAGIAVAVKKNFPEAYIADKELSLGAIERLGNFSYGSDVYFGEKAGGFNLLTFNLYSQYMPGRNLDTEALTLSLRKMAMHLKDDFPDGEEMKIGLPQIGCGIAGGNWKEVREIIKKELREFDVTVVIYKN